MHVSVPRCKTSLIGGSSMTEKRVARSDAVKFGKDFGAGATAAAISKTVMAPVERVKLILQLQAAQPTIEMDKRYKGIVDCFVRVPREQGFLSFWRGNAVNIVRGMSQESLAFAFKDFFKIWTLHGVNSEQKSQFLFGNLLAAGGSGVTTYLIIYPLDFVRTRLAVDMGKGEHREFRGFLHCCSSIIKHDGIVGLYKGLAPSLQYIFIYRSMYFGLFDFGKPFVAKDGKQLSFVRAFLLAQVAAFVAAMASYPHDTIRRRLMMQAGSAKPVYSGSVDCAKKILVLEGWRAFFSGAAVNLMRGTGAALILAIYNEISKHLN